MRAKDVNTINDGVLLFNANTLMFEASTRIVLTLPDGMEFTVDEFRNKIVQVANWFRDHMQEDTDEYCLLASKDAEDYNKYAGDKAENVIGRVGDYRIFIVKHS